MDAPVIDTDINDSTERIDDGPLTEEGNIIYNEQILNLIESETPLTMEDYKKAHDNIKLSFPSPTNDSVVSREELFVDQLSTGISATTMTDKDTEIGSIPTATLPKEMWSDGDFSLFRIRGIDYLRNQAKVSSPQPLFQLVATDIFELPAPLKNIATHPMNRVALAHARGDNKWTFVLNFMVPGPPHYAYVMYFVGDKTLIDADTPFGRIARPFFYGDDDIFRNNRFKIVPRIIQGNSLVKMAVRDTPTLIGNKLKVHYSRADHYFEVAIDVFSSRIARNIVGLVIGYSKYLVVDIGIVLQGNDDNELPEILMGTGRCSNVDMKLSPKLS